MAGRAIARPKEPEKGKDPIPVEESAPLSLQERIRERAHQIYLQRGPEHGTEVDDWLQAERQIREEQDREL